MKSEKKICKKRAGQKINTIKQNTGINNGYFSTPLRRNLYIKS